MIRAISCWTVCMLLMCRPAPAQMPDPRPNEVFSIARDDVMQFIESRLDANAHAATALLAVHQQFAVQHAEEAAAAQRGFEECQAQRKESGGGFGPEYRRDYGRLLCDWQRKRREILVQFEHAGANALDQSLAAAWARQTATWRRQRVLLEIDWAHKAEAMADLLAVLDRIKFTPEESQAISDVQSRYEAEMDAALRAWEQRIDPLWREYYDNEFDNRGDSRKRNTRRTALREQQRKLEQAVQDVNRRFLHELQSHLRGASATALDEGVNARDLPHLFAPSVVDALIELLREHGRLAEDQLGLLDGLHQAYVAQRSALRLRMIAAHRKWMEPKWVKQRIAERAAAIAAERSPLDSMRGHPGLAVLHALEDLEIATIRHMRETIAPEQFERLPEGLRMLLALE